MSNIPRDDTFELYTDLVFERTELTEFLDYWRTKCGTREFPERNEVKPSEMVKLLPWINMYDVIDGGETFRFRICGTALTDILGQEFRGKLVSELPPGLHARVVMLLQEVLKVRGPVRGHSTATALPGQDFQGVELCAAPLSSDGDEIDIIVAVAILETRT